MSKHRTVEGVELTADRRRFLRAAAGAAAATALSSLSVPAWAGEAVAPAKSASSVGKPARLIGIQIAPFNLLDEGIERCLDVIQETAAVNAIFCYTHTFYGIPFVPKGRPVEVLAPDHGIKLRDEDTRRLWPVWVRHNRASFKDTSLWFAERDAQAEYTDRDVFREVLAPARRRGIKVYGRILEPGANEVRQRIVNWSTIQSIDLEGRKAIEPCRNHPDYRAWWAAMMTDMFRNYELDGYQWGAERSGPLAMLLASGTPPSCFCEHCTTRANREGVDAERVRVGFRQLTKELDAAADGPDAPADSVAERILRCMLRYPEVLAWERQWRDSLEDLARLVYDSVKAVKPSAQVGRHLDHGNTTLNPLCRAGIDYAAMAAYTDFVKPILYHDVAGPRLARSVEGWAKRIARPLPPVAVLDLFSAFNGWQGAAQPTWEHVNDGLGPAYVGHETRRIAKILAGRAAVVPGIGLDVPVGSAAALKPMRSDPAKIEQAVASAFEAGAAGVLVSREYDEMRLPSLRAVGRAVRKAT